MHSYKKKRLDNFLVERGLAATRAQTADLVRRGCVNVGGMVATKPGALDAPDAVVEVTPDAAPYVSRGGLKLQAALDALPRPGREGGARPRRFDRGLHRCTARPRRSTHLCR